VRSAAAAVLLAAAVLAGCGRDPPTLTSAERQACERFAARADRPGTTTYEGVFAECVHNTLRPARGGG
jgi:hypothetical protein